MAVNQKKLEKLLTAFVKIRSNLASWRPSHERSSLTMELNDLEEQLVDILHDAGVSRLETKDFTIALRKSPPFFKVISRVRLVAALKRRHLSRFLVPDYSIDLQSLKQYLLENNISLPGLKKIDNRKSLYIFKKFSELEDYEDDFQLNILPELFVAHGNDPAVQNPREFWKQLWSDLRIIANVAYPQLKQGKTWGSWTLPDIKRYFANIIDSLRSVYFPIIEKDDNSSWWQLYRDSKEFMKSRPPDPDEVPEWDKKRKNLLSLETV